MLESLVNVTMTHVTHDLFDPSANDPSANDQSPLCL